MNGMKRDFTSVAEEKNKKIFPSFFLLFLSVILTVLIFNYENISSFANQAAVGYVTPFETIIVNVDAAKPMHIKTPESVKAIYMSSWVAGSPVYRKRLVDMIESTELNSVVIDVKDSTGKIAFEMEDPLVKSIGAFENRMPDARSFIKSLHEKNIYVIARIAVFQDPHVTKVQPEWAVRTKKTGAIWKDRNGLSWANMASREFWDYIVAIARESYKAGFDELNFDYVRFPSDGNMIDIAYPGFDEGMVTKAEQLRRFFEYLSENLRLTKAPLSVDLFGMTTTNTDDLNIGQVLENALPYFDYVAPMVYPSHYPPTFNGWKKLATVPYELIKFVMEEGVKRTIAASFSPNKLRPWLQDFDLGAIYTAPMVRDQIQATYDVGLNSWMLWDAGNKYTLSVLEPEVK
ncbi:MAG: hypothetical protein HZA94_02280 [Candidatus Vogelbacteria bacterium]|nr:hypothetical protein [Candidatus Vogelbacteria bacterium]